MSNFFNLPSFDAFDFVEFANSFKEGVVAGLAGEAANIERKLAVDKVELTNRTVQSTLPLVVLAQIGRVVEDALAGKSTSQSELLWRAVDAYPTAGQRKSAKAMLAPYMVLIEAGDHAVERVAKEATGLFDVFVVEHDNVRV